MTPSDIWKYFSKSAGFLSEFWIEEPLSVVGLPGSPMGSWRDHLLKSMPLLLPPLPLPFPSDGVSPPFGSPLPFSEEEASVGSAPLSEGLDFAGTARASGRRRSIWNTEALTETIMGVLLASI